MWVRRFPMEPGALLWEDPEPVGAALGLGNGQVLLTAHFGVRAFDAMNGRVQWSTPPQSTESLSGEPLFSAGRVFLAGDRRRIEPPFGMFEALFQVRDAR